MLPASRVGGLGGAWEGKTCVTRVAMWSCFFEARDQSPNETRRAKVAKAI